MGVKDKVPGLGGDLDESNIDTRCDWKKLEKTGIAPCQFVHTKKGVTIASGMWKRHGPKNYSPVQPIRSSDGQPLSDKKKEKLEKLAMRRFKAYEKSK